MRNTPPPPFTYAPPATPDLPVLHADAHLLVLDKPSGLLTVPGKTEELADCLESRVRKRYSSATTVHRLDKDTSGVIVMALTPQTHRHLGLQFERRHVGKAYVARVWGHPAADEGTVDLPLAADWPNRPRQQVDHANGRSAVTRWQVLAREETATRLRLEPLTGRTHQLRVHMAVLGHPILGDALYASGEALTAAPRLQLHAASLTLRHPEGGHPCTFEAPVPF